MAVLTPEQQKLFADASARRGTMKKMERDNDTDAKVMDAELRGKRIRCRGLSYEITRISSAWLAGFEARGRRILKETGKPGHKEWYIGLLLPEHFEGVE